jgi:hypothetical protein
MPLIDGFLNGNGSRSLNMEGIWKTRVRRFRIFMARNGEAEREEGRYILK